MGNLVRLGASDKRVRTVVILGIAGLLAFPVLTRSGQVTEAKDLNAKGYRLYKEKKFDEAYNIYKKAVESDPSYGMAHYNFACTMAILWDSTPCNGDFAPTDVLKELALAVQYDRSRSARMAVDPDLKNFRKYFQYHVMTGRSPKDAKDVKFILENVRWNGPRPGTILLSRIGFTAPDKVLIERANITASDVSYDRFEGTYRVDGETIAIKLNSPYLGHSNFVGKLKADGLWGVLDFGGEIENFTDREDWCSD